MSSVSRSRGRERGRPDTLGRARLTWRFGRERGVKAGELVGEADMRTSWSLLSSSAFRFRLLVGWDGVDTGKRWSVSIGATEKKTAEHIFHRLTGTRGRETGVLVEMWRDGRCGHQAVHDDVKVVKQPDSTAPEATRDAAVRVRPGRRQEAQGLTRVGGGGKR